MTHSISEASSKETRTTNLLSKLIAKVTTVSLIKKSQKKSNPNNTQKGTEKINPDKKKKEGQIQQKCTILVRIN